MFKDYPDILTVDEIMEILYISRNTAYALLRSGKIRSFKIGHIWKIPKIAVEEYIGYRELPIRKNITSKEKIVTQFR